MRRALVLMLAAAALVLTRPASAQPLVADLSDHLIAVTAGFSGTDVLLFGATDGAGDVVVVVQGPEERLTVRRKDRVVGIWLNQDSMSYERVPSLYFVASNRPLAEIAPKTGLARHRIGVDHILLRPVERDTAAAEAAFAAALIRNKQAQGLYSHAPGQVVFLGGQLFRADVSFPANVPTGSYSVTVYLFREGRLVGAQSTPLVVSKIGIGARIYDFAQQQSALYGIAAILMALAAGWLAGAVFRR
ncbi:MAG: TIGR02186 family protein [Alphaproteobacteria bacterium]